MYMTYIFGSSAESFPVANIWIACFYPLDLLSTSQSHIQTRHVMNISTYIYLSAASFNLTELEHNNNINYNINCIYI